MDGRRWTVTQHLMALAGIVCTAGVGVKAQDFSATLPPARLSGASLAVAQEAPPAANGSRLTVLLRLRDGRLIADCEQAHFTRSPRFDQTVVRGLDDARFTKALCADIDRVLSQLPRAFYYTLTTSQQAHEDRGRLPADSTIDAARTFSGPIKDFPLVSALQLPFSSDILPVLQRRLPTISPLIGPREPDDEAAIIVTDALSFAVRDPVPDFQAGHATITFGHLAHPLLDANGVAKLLEPLRGLPLNVEDIHRLLDDFYVSRGYSPRIDVDAKTTPLTITILEARIGAILLPAGLDDPNQALVVFWSAAPNQVFRAFREHAHQILTSPLSSGSSLRQVDFTALSSTPLPPLQSGLLQNQQASLAAAGYQATLVDLGGDGSMVGLVVVPASVSNGASAGEAPPTDASRPTGRPGEFLNPHPATASPVPNGNADETDKMLAPQRDRRYFLGGGVDFKPGQGFRLFGAGHARRLLGADLMSIEAGGNGSGFATGSYSRDFIGLPALGMRLSAAAHGGTTYVQQRLLVMGSTDERRTEAAGRIDLETFRERNGQALTVSFEGRHTTVRLTPADLPATVVDVNGFELGADYSWARRAAGLPSTLRVQPRVLFGDLRTETGGSYQLFRCDVEWRQNVSTRWPLEMNNRLHIGLASSGTPVFDLPSLGGVESLRGFREDDALGRRYWALQNEVWIPLTWLADGGSKAGDFVRRNLWLAPFLDVGGVARSATSTASTRLGIGIGPRMRYNGAMFGLDVGYGFGDGASGHGRGRLYFSIRLP